jgi:hypothetical protein
MEQLMEEENHVLLQAESVDIDQQHQPQLLLISSHAAQGTSMPHLVMMYPRSFPRGIAKVHFSGFSLMLKRLRLVKVSSRSMMRLLPC